MFCSVFTAYTQTALFVLSVAGLESVKRLQKLSVDHNQLISTKGLRDVYTLLHLSCSHNHLTNVEGLENSALLHTLDLTANSLTEVKPAADVTDDSGNWLEGAVGWCFCRCSWIRPTASCSFHPSELRPGDLMCDIVCEVCQTLMKDTN